MSDQARSDMTNETGVMEFCLWRFKALKMLLKQTKRGSQRIVYLNCYDNCSQDYYNNNHLQAL